MAQDSVRIFLSYTRKDQEQVEWLHQRLCEAGFRPWMDTKDLLPGQKFEYHIKKAIRQSDFFLACLSNNSVNRRGVIQREIKEALDVLQEKLESDIYLIPVRLEACEVPESLREFHWANLYENDGLNKLVQAIQTGIANQNATTDHEEAGQVKSITEDPVSQRAHQQHREEEDLEAEYDLLSEKISRLRKARIIETDEATRFKLDKQIEEAEQEREKIERQLEKLLQSTPRKPQLKVKKEEKRKTANETCAVHTFETVAVDAKGKVVKRIKCEAEQQSADLGNGVTLEMVRIPSGTFWMGQTDAEKEYLLKTLQKDYDNWYKNELPRHEVRVAEFWIGKYPVTQAQWKAVMGENPSNFKGANRPVENVSWNDVQEFLQKLNGTLKKNGKNPPLPLPGGETLHNPLLGGAGVGGEFRLPSEAEWEYACRAGTTTPFYFGETLTPDLANYNGNYTYASGPKGKFREQTTEVGSFPPNAFGLYDMHGNVWEWCADPWHENYEGAPIDGSVWEEGGDINLRLLRGGSFWIVREGPALRQPCQVQAWLPELQRGVSSGAGGVRAVNVLNAGFLNSGF